MPPPRYPMSTYATRLRELHESLPLSGKKLSSHEVNQMQVN